MNILLIIQTIEIPHNQLIVCFLIHDKILYSLTPNTEYISYYQAAERRWSLKLLNWKQKGESLKLCPLEQHSPEPRRYRRVSAGS